MSEDTKNPDLEQETNSEEEQEDETSNEDESNSSEVDVEELQKELAKYKRLARKNITSKEETTKKPSTSEYEQRIERLELKQDGYSDEIIEEIMALGGKSALSNKVVKTAVESMVQQERTERAGAVDGSSQSGTKSNVSLEELKTMSSAEMAKHLPKAQ